MCIWWVVEFRVEEGRYVAGVYEATSVEKVNTGVIISEPFGRFSMCVASMRARYRRGNRARVCAITDTSSDWRRSPVFLKIE